MTSDKDEDIIIRHGRHCEFVIAYDDKEKGLMKWIVSALFKGRTGEYIGYKYIADADTPATAQVLVSQLIAKGA